MTPMLMDAFVAYGTTMEALMGHVPASRDDYAWLLLRREFLDAHDDLNCLLHEAYDGMVFCGSLRVTADNEGGVMFATSDGWATAWKAGPQCN